MAKMTGIAVPAVLTAVAVGAVPVSAAPMLHRQQTSKPPVSYAGFGEATNLQRNIVRLDTDIGRALAGRLISSREAAGLHRDVNRLESLLADCRRAGLTQDDVREIEAGVAEIDSALRFDRRDSDGRRG